MIKEHYDAVRALVPAGVRTYMWSVPDSPDFPYVVLWGDLGLESSGDVAGESLGFVPTSLSLRVRATYAGLTGDSLLITARNVRKGLSRRTPVVAGRVCSGLLQAPLMDAQTDTSVTFTDGTNPVFAVDEFTFTSDAL